MILLFLGSWRSTLIVVTSIPLSILVAFICLSALGQTVNLMTLGGLSLAVGILVDDATVEIENVHRHMAMKKPLMQAILDGAQQIAVPAFVATLCICIVFVPIGFISGAARSLFTPLGMAVVFAMMTSYVLSRTLVPTMVHYLLASEVSHYTGGDPGRDRRGRRARSEAQRARGVGKVSGVRRRAQSTVGFLADSTFLPSTAVGEVALELVSVPAVDPHLTREDQRAVERQEREAVAQAVRLAVGVAQCRGAA
jgi:multidrug efflux pump subunit AcrB